MRAGRAICAEGQRDEDDEDRGVGPDEVVAQREEQRTADQEDGQLVQEADVQRGPDERLVAGAVISREQFERPRLEQADIDEVQQKREREIETAARSECGDQKREDEIEGRLRRDYQSPGTTLLTLSGQKPCRNVAVKITWSGPMPLGAL